MFYDFIINTLIIFSLNKKCWHILDINVRNFNKMLTNAVVSVEQPGPDDEGPRIPKQVTKVQIRQRITQTGFLILQAFQTQLVDFLKMFRIYSTVRWCFNPLQNGPKYVHHLYHLKMLLCPF